MKLIIILFTMLLIFGCGSSTGTKTSIRDKVTVKENSLPSSKKYHTEEFEIPECLDSNPKVQFIKTDDDWNMISAKRKTIFCVKPGAYHGEIYVKRKGTKENPLYLLLDNGNDDHPVKLDKSLLANVSLRFEDSDYWIVDRMANIDTFGEIDDSIVPMVFINSSNNIINRYYATHANDGIEIRDNSNNNVIQNSRIENMTDIGRRNDRSCILLLTRNKNSEVKNTKIIKNELKNCNDGVHLLWRSNVGSVKYNGTVIYDNDISVDSSIYTDCNGTLTPSGECSYSEGAIDIKSGSSDINNPIIIRRNRMWGFRKSDTTNSLEADPGVAVVFHHGVTHVVVEDNVIFDSAQGIMAVDKEPKEYSLSSSNMVNNFMTDVRRPFVLSDAKDIDIYDNYINRSKVAWFASYGSKNIKLYDNWIANKLDSSGIDSEDSIIEEGVTNYFKIETSKIESRDFFTDKFSVTPTLVKVLK